MAEARARTAEILQSDRNGLLNDWMTELRKAATDQRISEAELTAQASALLSVIADSAAHSTDVASEAWRPVRENLDQLTKSRAVQGFSSGETATFIFSLKKPLFSRVRGAVKDPQALADETWAISELVDALGVHTVKMFQKTREEVIARQQEEMLELSTPVVKLWDGVIALPMIGTLDSARTQIVMESLLQRLVDTGAEIAIIDITGVPTVDTLVAQHLLKTVTAIRLMGAECIISGIRPQIAQTIVHLGVDLQGVTTKATLADALAIALKQVGLTVTKARPVQSA
jgi:rsbT co-antagonist protein RsbR